MLRERETISNGSVDVRGKDKSRKHKEKDQTWKQEQVCEGHFGGGLL